MTKNLKLNPTPISKLLATLILSFGLAIPTNEYFAVLIVLFISLFFALNQRLKTAIYTIIFYGCIIFLYENLQDVDQQIVKNYVFIFVMIFKLFFLPFLAGKFLIATSEVSAMIVSFEKMHFPKSLVLPLAVVFRYFPAFKDDKKHIKMAMNMRGISFIHPLRYMEYVSVPLLISAINLSDDIAKAAETKCISAPGEKNRYTEVKFSFIDFIYLAGIISLNILGKIYA